MKKILLTGAAGFIGSHLAEALIQQGAGVRAFLHYNSRGDPGLLRHIPAALFKEIEMISGDLADADAVHQAVKGCDTVFHLGALTSIPYGLHHPQQVVAANVNGTLNVLIACRDAGVQRLLHTSAGEVYGAPRELPVHEDHPLHGQTPYAASKISADKLAESFYCSYGLPVVTLRPFNVYGPRQQARAIIPGLITQALACPEIHPGSLETRRDYTYVADVVAGFLRAERAPGVEGQVYNLATGHQVTTAQLLHAILDLTPQFGRAGCPPVVTSPRRVEGPPVAAYAQPALLGYETAPRTPSDNSRAHTDLGWSPSTPLNEGLRHTIAWVAGHLEAYRSGVGEM